MRLVLLFIVICRKTVSHDWDKVHKDGKTMFRLPKECITGHVEGWTFIRTLLTVVIFMNLSYDTCSLVCFWQARP